MELTKQALKDYNFKYNRRLSNEDNEIYSLYFPVTFYKNKPTLECRLDYDFKSKTYITNVFKFNTGVVYHPYYAEQYNSCHKSLIKKVNKEINKALYVIFGGGNYELLPQ